MQIRFVPRALVQPYIQEPYYGVQPVPSDWDVAYLKMLCLYAEIDSSQLYLDKGVLLQLNELRDSFMGNQIHYEDWISHNINTFS